MKVTGTVPERALANDERTIIMKTIPEAPMIPPEPTNEFAIVVASPVTTIIASRGSDPYFSSRSGPKRRTNIMFPAKWSKET